MKVHGAKGSPPSTFYKVLTLSMECRVVFVCLFVFLLRRKYLIFLCPKLLPLLKSSCSAGGGDGE